MTADNGEALMPVPLSAIRDFGCAEYEVTDSYRDIVSFNAYRFTCDVQVQPSVVVDPRRPGNRQFDPRIGRQLIFGLE